MPVKVKVQPDGSIVYLGTVSSGGMPVWTDDTDSWDDPTDEFVIIVNGVDGSQINPIVEVLSYKWMVQVDESDLPIGSGTVLCQTKIRIVDPGFAGYFDHIDGSPGVGWYQWPIPTNAIGTNIGVGYVKQDSSGAVYSGTMLANGDTGSVLMSLSVIDLDNGGASGDTGIVRTTYPWDFAENDIASWSVAYPIRFE